MEAEVSGTFYGSVSTPFCDSEILMRRSLLKFGVLVIVAICLGGQISELFDRWRKQRSVETMSTAPALLSLQLLALRLCSPGC
jgi:hypothetical protein